MWQHFPVPHSQNLIIQNKKKIHQEPHSDCTRPVQYPNAEVRLQEWQPRAAGLPISHLSRAPNGAEFMCTGSVTFFRIRGFASPWIMKSTTSHKLEEIVCILTPRKQFKRISHSYIQMWKLDYEGWTLKNRCFQTVVPEKTLESPLNSKKMKRLNLKENQSWIFIGRTRWSWSASTLANWCEQPTHGKDPDAGKDWRQKVKGVAEDEIVI